MSRARENCCLPFATPPVLSTSMDLAGAIAAQLGAHLREPEMDIVLAYLRKKKQPRLVEERGPEQLTSLFFFGSLFSLEPITISICGILCAASYAPRAWSWWENRRRLRRV